MPPGSRIPARGSRELRAEKKKSRCPLPYRLGGKSMPSSRYRAGLARIVRMPVSITFNFAEKPPKGQKIQCIWRESGDRLVEHGVRRRGSMLGTILIVVLVLVLIGAIPT